MKVNKCLNKQVLKEIEKTTIFLKLIAEENRLKILCFLKTGERCVCDIWQELDIPQNLASHHLKELKEFGLIKSRKDGLRVIYSINKETVNKLKKSLDKFII